MGKTTKKSKSIDAFEKPKEEAPEIKAEEEKKKKDKDKDKKKALPKRIRVLLSLANSRKSFISGKSYEVGMDVSEETARSWLDSGVAIEDKSLEGPKETK